MNLDVLAEIHGPSAVMRACQYLYYVKHNSVISDYKYDIWCKSKDLFGGGGSDRESDYSEREKAIANALRICYGQD